MSISACNAEAEGTETRTSTPGSENLWKMWTLVPSSREQKLHCENRNATPEVPILIFPRNYLSKSVASITEQGGLLCETIQRALLTS